MIIDDNIVNDNNSFIYNNKTFCLYEYQRNVDEIESIVILNRIMLSRDIKINKIINNIFNQPITYYNDKKYVLIEIHYEYNNNFSYKYIESFNNVKLNILKRNNWGELWSIKIDYIEYQLTHIKKQFPIINSSINYYIGLAENAISYYNMLDLSNVSLYVEHRRFNIENMFNPIELVIDYKVRDISEYIKWSFFYKKLSISEIKEYINKFNFENIDYILLYVRLLFPSYYFDLYEKIVNNNIDELEINNIILLSSQYEELLYEIYLMIKNKINIFGIKWINDKFTSDRIIFCKTD